MKPLYLKVVLADHSVDEAAVPAAEREFLVVDGIEVTIVPMISGNPTGQTEWLRLTPDAATGLFSVNAPSYKVSRDHFLRIGFLKPNFSKTMKQLLAPVDVTPNAAPLFYPSRLPYWDTGWDDDYETNEYFDDDLIPDTSAAQPLIINVPIRDFYNVSHHGARTVYPENTLASYDQALNEGVNGIEIDICFTKDKNLLVFHDTSPLSFTSMYRPLTEDLPLWLVSPKFLPSKDNPQSVVISDYQNGVYTNRAPRPLQAHDEFDLINLTTAQVRESYHYTLVNNKEYVIPSLDEFFTWAQSRLDKLKFLFIDVKNPNWDKNNDTAKYTEYAAAIAAAVKKTSALPLKVFVCNEYPEVLSIIRNQFYSTGEGRCEFSWDAQGSLLAAIGIKDNPVSIARRMNNTGVSIGASLRAGDFNEVREAIRDRDYKQASPIETVIYWVLNDPSDFYDAFTVGVNAILTDKPADLLKLLARLKVKIL
jgi:glycerophosphoryl diester phosphodiesterase